MEIFISGSLAFDRIMTFPGKFREHILPEKLHILNVCFVVNGITEKFGGTAGNIAYSLSLLGEKPLILATAGRDFDNYEAWLRRHSLPLKGIRKIEEELTAGAYITTDMRDNQITGFNPGAMNHPSRFEFDDLMKAGSLAIISPGNIEDMMAYSRAYKTSGIPYIFDPGQMIPALAGDQLTELITGADILISNDYELEMIMRAATLEKADILGRTKTVITTLGEDGSIITTPEGEVKISAADADSVKDPTGAGDAYRAGLIKGLVMKKDLEEAARMGATCASFAVEHHGTQVHRFSTEEFWNRYHANFGNE
jgi:adenosine kinase